MGGERKGGGKRDLQSGRRQEGCKFSDRRKRGRQLRGKIKCPFFSFFWRFQIELC